MTIAPFVPFPAAARRYAFPGVASTLLFYVNVLIRLDVPEITSGGRKTTIGAGQKEIDTTRGETNASLGRRVPRFSAEI